MFVNSGFCNHGRRRSNQSELRVVNARSNQMIVVASVCETEELVLGRTYLCSQLVLRLDQSTPTLLSRCDETPPLD